jgi:hypothetical protein
MLIAGLAVVVIAIAIVFPHVRRAHQRRQWRKLPPPPKRVEVDDVVLRLPRRGLRVTRKDDPKTFWD